MKRNTSYIMSETSAIKHTGGIIKNGKRFFIFGAKPPASYIPDYWTFSVYIPSEISNCNNSNQNRSNENTKNLIQFHIIKNI